MVYPFLMKIMETIGRRLRFDEPDGRFELLETEHGQPSFFHGQKRTPAPEPPDERPVSPHLKENRRRLESAFFREVNTDLILRDFRFCGSINALAAFLNGMADGNEISDFILKRAMEYALPPSGRDLADHALREVFSLHEAEKTDRWAQVEEAILEGRTAVLLEGAGEAILLDTRGYACRGVGTAQNESTVIGPSEAFHENLRISITLLRRMIRRADLVCEFRDIGSKNNVKLALCYLGSVCNEGLLQEVKKRLSKVQTDVLLSAGTLGQHIEDRPWSPAPQTLLTERPDRAANAVMEGKIVILVEGSPQALILPVTLSGLLLTAEDSYLRRPAGSILRFVRLFGAAVSVLMPAYFLALAYHHQGLLSSDILSTVVSSRKLVFLPMGAEMIFLLLVFQLVREAGVRVPGVVGQTVGIIGGLILGQAAVSANFVSTVALIIVALTGLGNFVIPNYDLQIAVACYRVALCLLAIAGGLLGLSCGIMAALILLADQKSFGVPFLAPYAPKTVARETLFFRGAVRGQGRPHDDMNGEAGL